MGMRLVTVCFCLAILCILDSMVSGGVVMMVSVTGEVGGGGVVMIVSGGQMLPSL